MKNFPCTLCGSRDWPDPHSSCPNCRAREKNWNPVVADLLLLLQRDGYELTSADGQMLFGTPRSRRQEAKRIICDLDECDLYVSKDGREFWIFIVLGNEPSETVCDFTLNENLEKIIDKFCDLWEGRACPTR